MEEIINGEQPKVNITESENGAIMQNEEMAQQKCENGSPLDKFKNFSELEKAYVSLEKEFTKKCQALKELKEQCDNVEKPSTPQYLQEGWTEKVKDFFAVTPQAKQFAEEISSVLSSDKVLASSENSLERAYEKVKANNFRTKDEMIKDDSFISNYVLTNGEIREKIINDYLSQVMANKVAPLISNGSGANVMVTPKSKPSSLKEAGNYMLAMMNLK